MNLEKISIKPIRTHTGSSMFFTEKKEESKLYPIRVLNVMTGEVTYITYENVYNFRYYQQRKKGLIKYEKEGTVLKPIS